MILEKLQSFVDQRFETDIVERLQEYIAIPAKSPHYDAQWQENGHIERAIGLLETWCKARPIAGLTVEIVRLPGRTPLLFMEIPGFGADAPENDTVLLYGHYDKQPEMSGWDADLGPWTPVRRGEKLYGRGGADDGYAAFASLTAIEAVQAQGGSHARCVVLIEGCEESGSYDLPFYVEHLLPRIGIPSLVVCLDSGAGDYERLWMTTSLRGLVGGTLSVQVLEQGVHSGSASGVVPSSFRIARLLLARIEEAETGTILLDSLHTSIPSVRREQARAAAEVLGDGVVKQFPWAGGTQPMQLGTPPVDALDRLAQLSLARTWLPALSVVGADGLPALEEAGNVLRPVTRLKLSIRVPPGVDSERAQRELADVLQNDPPHGATVRFEPDQAAVGWHAPVESAWLREALSEASRRHFQADAAYMGEGGTIPFMAMLGERFPQAEFVITGVLGPQSNAHGPNEFLHIGMAKRLTGCVADVLVRHARR